MINVSVTQRLLYFYYCIHEALLETEHISKPTVELSFTLFPFEIPQVKTLNG